MTAQDIQFSKSNDIRDILVADKNERRQVTYQQESHRRCSFCGELLWRAGFNDKRDRLVCRRQRCGRYLQHQGYARRES